MLTGEELTALRPLLPLPYVWPVMSTAWARGGVPTQGPKLKPTVHSAPGSPPGGGGLLCTRSALSCALLPRQTPPATLLAHPMAPHKAPELRRPHGAEGLQRPGPPRARHPGFTADAQSTLEPVEELGETVVGPGGTEQTHCPEKRREERERRAGHTLLPSSDASCRV